MHSLVNRNLRWLALACIVTSFIACSKKKESQPEEKITTSFTTTIIQTKYYQKFFIDTSKYVADSALYTYDPGKDLLRVGSYLNGRKNFDVNIKGPIVTGKEYKVVIPRGSIDALLSMQAQMSYSPSVIGVGLDSGGITLSRVDFSKKVITGVFQVSHGDAKSDNLHATFKNG